MSPATVANRTSAAVHGPRWSVRAADWALFAAGFSRPAWEAVADRTRIAAGTRVLDLGCGSGEFCALAAARGATASGIDAAEGMIAVARQLAPDADLRVGAMEHLPWDNRSFDAVTAFNALQFAADFTTALLEATRVVRPGGRVAICNWGRPADSELFAVMRALAELQPPRAEPPPPDPPPIGEPGVLEDLCRHAGLEPLQAAHIDVPFHAPDRHTLERALLAPGAVSPAIERAGELAVRGTLVAAATPFMRADGSYRLQNRFRYVIAERHALDDA